MLRLASAQLLARKRRLIGTGLAIVLGVGFLCGTLVLGDTLSHNFDRLFSDVSAGTDVVVRNATAVDPNAILDDRGPIPASVVATIARVPGVAAAEGQIVGYGSLLGADGKPIGGNGPPRQAGSWVDDPGLNPYRLVDGRAPRGPNEVVVNRGAMKAGKLHLGDSTIVQTPEPVPVTIVGVATFGSSDGFGQATWTAFTLAGAQAAVTHRADAVSSVLVRAEAGTSATTLRQRIGAALPAGTEAITGAKLADERTGAVNRQFLGMLRTFLVVFALVALLVSGITIANTFSITLAQRTRELALLRAVGASRRQIRRLVGVEALLVGAGFSAVGIVAGLGLAELLKGLFDAFGGALPAGGLTVRPTSALIAFAAGLAVTLLAARSSARRAGRIAPMAALADLADGLDGPARRRAAIGLAVLAAGAAVGVTGAVSGSAALAGLGAFGLLVGAIVAAPAAIGPVGRVLAGAFRALRMRNVELAEGGLRRHPRRSAATATALIVGVAVVSFFTVFAASLKQAIASDVQGSFRADLAITTAVFGGNQLSPHTMEAVEAVPGVDRVVGLGLATVLLDGHSTQATATDIGSIDRVIALQTASGSLDRVGSDGLAISKGTASANGWKLGDTVTATFSDGAPVALTVRAIYDTDDLAGPVLIPASVWSAHTLQPTLRTVMVTVTPGASLSQVRAALTPVATRFGGDLQDGAQLAALGAGLDRLLGIVYVLLALAIIVALLGIANALSLAVHDRRREIGLLRAVGQTRRQVRRVLRMEAIMIAAFGTLAGITVGSFAGWALFTAVATTPGFTLPVARLAIVAIVGALAGALAARRPARRAARLPILEAIAQ